MKRQEWMSTNGIGIKKIIGIITLALICLVTFIITYNVVYNKTVAKEDVLKRREEKEKLSRKVWIAEITNARGSQLNELIKLDKEYKFNSTTLKLISEIAHKFNVKPNKIIAALGMIDFNNPQTTKQRINLTLKKQKDKLYWLETKYVSQQASYIKERKEIINMCQIELALLNKAAKNKEIKKELQSIRAQYLHQSYPRLYPWKKEAKEGGGH